MHQRASTAYSRVYLASVQSVRRLLCPYRGAHSGQTCVQEQAVCPHQRRWQDFACWVGFSQAFPCGSQGWGNNLESVLKPGSGHVPPLLWSLSEGFPLLYEMPTHFIL